MKESKLHLRVIIAEIITIIGIIGVFACALFMLIKAGNAQDTASGTWQYYFNQWANSVQAKEGFDVLTLVLSLVGSLVGFVFGILSMVFGIKARRYVGIWYFFQMETAGGALGLGISSIIPMLKIIDLNVGFNYYGALLFAFIGGVLLFIFLLIQFVLFMKECHQIIKERKENVETKEVEEAPANEGTTTSVENETVAPTNNDEPVVAPVVNKEETTEKVEPTNNEKVEEKPVEKKPTTSTKKDTTVAKKTSQNSKKEVKKSTPTNPKVEDKKVDDKVTSDKAPVKSSGKVYHISQHPTSNKWQVKLAKGEKALKLFDTQAEAINYAKEVASNQGGSIRVHSREGKIRKA